MIAADALTRLPTTAAVLVFATLSQLAASHVLPRETKTLNVVEWPLVAAPGPTSPAEMKQRRQLNTICGYLGGDPSLPATCMAGSHCVVDVDYSAVGCCPDSGPCTAGIFTGCVDVNSPPQTVLDPYVYTCAGSEVCYMNNFEGGYFQYGCGSASHLATTVATTALSRLPLDFSRVSVALTALPTPLSQPTTIGSPSSTTGSGSATTTATTTSATAHSTGASDSSNTATTSSGDATSTADPSAPTSPSSSNSTGPIVGGVIGGLAALAVVGVFAFWLWRRKHNAGLPEQYINPSTEKYEEFRAHPYAQDASGALANSDAAAPFQPNNANRGGQDSSAAALAVPMDNSRNRPSDEIPLTVQGQRAQGSGITATTEIEVEAYPVPRRAGGGGGGGYLWSQNRSEPRTRSRARD